MIGTAVDDQVSDDAVAKEVLLRLEPNIHLLYASLRRSKEDAPSDASAHLLLLKRQAELLSNLNHGLGCLEQNNNKVVDALCAGPIRDYLTMPLLTLMHATGVDWSSRGDSSNQIILQSARWKVVEYATRALSTFLVLFSRERPGLLPFEWRVRALTACVHALPAGNQVSECLSASNTGLDRGVECFVEILGAISNLIPTPEMYEEPSDGELAQAVSKAMNGRMVARMIDSCIGVWGAFCDSKCRTFSDALHSAASQTVVTIEKGVPVSKVWRQVFPGCFSGVYRYIIRTIKTGQPAKTVGALNALTCLLQVSMQLPDSETPVESSELVLKNLKALAIKANEQPLDDHDPKKDDDFDSKFFTEVRTRLPGPLASLANLLCTHQAEAVRKEAVLLYKAILSGAANVWKDTKIDLTTAVLEDLLVLVMDDESSVQSVAKKALNECQSLQSSDQLVTSSRLVSILQEIPSLVHRQRENELHARLRLLLAYLSTLAENASSSKAFKSMLRTEHVQKEFQLAFACLFEVDFDSTFQMTVYATKTDCHGISCPRPPLLRHMSADTERTAFECLSSLGKLLGPRHAVLVIDSMVADIYDSQVLRLEKGPSGQTCGGLVDESIGRLRTVKEILAGAFGENESAAGGKAKRRRDQILKELASSIIPVLACLVESQSSGETRKNFESSETMDTSSTSTLTARTSNPDSAFQRGRACVVYMSLDLIGDFIHFLGCHDGRSLVGPFIALILELNGSRHVPLVREMALYTLQRLALALSYDNVSQLLLDDVPLILNSIHARLRLPGGRTPTVHDAMDSSILSALDSTTSLISSLPSVNLQTSLSSLHRLVLELVSRFDLSAVATSNDTMRILSFLRLFDVTMKQLLDCHQGETTMNATGTSGDQATESFMDELDSFRKDAIDCSGAAEGFEAFRKAQTPSSDTTAVDDAPMNGYIAFVKEILSRCCYLLSYPNLTIQISSCDVLINGFAFLAWVAKNFPDSGESNGPKTAILRQVHFVWPAVSGRLEATTNAVLPSNETSLLVVNSSSTSPRTATSGEQRIFLSKLFTMISHMSECAGDFMANRLRTNVWPCIGKVMQAHTRRSFSDVALIPLSVDRLNKRRNQTNALPESELQLVQSVVSCLTRVFGYRPVGLCLADLIPSAAAMLFPFLDDDVLCPPCTEALQNMLRIDSDALWRPLHLLSELDLPPCPLWAFEREEKAVETMKPVSKQVQASRRLFAFAQSIPEQELF